MKKIFLLILLFLSLFAETTQVSITANNFEANENQHHTIFNGNVIISKNSDFIYAKKAIVEFDKKNKPIKYRAINNVNFTITLKNSVIKGSCDELIFVPNSKVYKLKNNIKIIEEPSNRKIQATKVIIDTKLNKINISGEKNKPVKFIFEVEEK